MEAKPPTGLEKFILKYPFYIRIAFGFIILFGMVGNCAGHREGSAVVFVLTAVVWVCTRIIQEALNAWQVLRMASAFEEEMKKTDKKDEPPSDPGTSGPPTGT